MASKLTGQSIERVEDARLLTGQGRFVGAMDRAGLLHAAFVRSPVAHARIVAVDAAAARQAPGVVAVFDGDDVAATMTGPMSVMGPPALKTAPYWPLARGKVRLVGDPVAIVVADTKAHAVDAAGLVDVQYDALEAVVTFDHARDPARPALWDETGTNVIYEDNVTYGRPFTEVAASAAHLVRRRYAQHRYAHVPIEGRGAIADYSTFGQSMQYDMANKRPHSLKMSLAAMLGIPYPNVHARSGDIGGAFGSKGQTTREDIALGAAAKMLGRSIKWIEDRSENLQAAGHAREENVDIEAAVAADGRVLGLRVSMEIDVGAYPMLPFPASMFAGMVRALLPNALRLESYEFSTTTVMTNKASYIAYRAPWTIETVVRERLLDEIARELDVDAIDIRRINLVRAEDQPTQMITGVSMTGVTVQECLERAVSMAELDEFRVAQENARERGHYLGIGFASFVEIAPGPPDFAKSLGFDLPSETAWARVEPTGDVVIQTWQVNHGQGHETTLGQIVADEMGVPLARVRIEWGSSDNTPFNTMSTGGSRSATMGAGAAKMATRAAKQKVLQIAAKMLEANADDLEIVDGAISVRGTPAKAVTMADVARLAWFAPSSLPEGMQQGIETSVDFKVPPTGGWVSACHVCWVDIDIETGRIEIPRYLVVEDCGDLINPAIVDGQIRGGVIQGIASVLLEKHVYDNDGQLLTSSLADYLVPAACDVPAIDIEHMHSPPQHEVNSRGVGEGGLLGAPAAVLNAVADALGPLGVAINETHLPPQRIRELIDQANGA